MSAGRPQIRRLLFLVTIIIGGHQFLFDRVEVSLTQTVFKNIFTGLTDAFLAEGLDRADDKRW